MKSVIVLLLSVSMFSSVAMAQYEVAACQSTAGTNHAFSLIMANKNLLQVRIRVNSHRVRVLNPIISSEQNVEGSTVYMITGMTGDLQVQNQVLEGGEGFVKLSGEEFSCK